MARILALGMMAMAAAGQMITLSNQTFPEDGENQVELAIESHEYMRFIPIVGLTSAAMMNTPNIQSPLLLANASSQLQISNTNIVLISCDPYDGIIQPWNVYDTAAQRNATAIVLYTENAESCALNGGTYDRVYTVVDQASSSRMLDWIITYNLDEGVIAPRGAFGDPNATQTTSSPSGTASPSPLGPSPSTAVAMIILYSITGIITALFLAIIITGAVRAHRHPERYGPRRGGTGGVGSTGRSRAKGLAMAMLETIPIVKFGDRTAETRSKDVELAEAEAGTEERRDVSEEGREAKAAQANGTTENGFGESSTTHQESGIAAAVERPTSPPQTSEESSAQGCSICTEDFKIGEDQRVLPCDHRFHPACIDPWLLNVSGTCPLCRIDLRETTTSAADDSTTDEGLAPPLDDNARRQSRRSIFGTFIRPERMTREERVSALRQYRERQEGRDGQHEERSLRERLRGKFRIRTRRTGDEEQPAPSSAAEDSAAGSTR